MKHPFIIDRPVTISNERVVGFILSRFRKQFNLLLIYFRENWPPIYQYVTSCVFLYHPCSDILNHSISYYLVFDSPPAKQQGLALFMPDLAILPILFHAIEFKIQN